MKPLQWVVLLVTLLCVTTLVNGNSTNWRPIEGIFAITGNSLIDPPTDERRNTHFRIQLRGESAKALYTNMLVSAQHDECTGYQAKTIGNMKCLFDRQHGEYECHFSIDIANQQIEYGTVC